MMKNYIRLVLLLTSAFVVTGGQASHLSTKDQERLKVLQELNIEDKVQAVVGSLFDHEQEIKANVEKLRSDREKKELLFKQQQSDKEREQAEKDAIHLRVSGDVNYDEAIEREKLAEEHSFAQKNLTDQFKKEQQNALVRQTARETKTRERIQAFDAAHQAHRQVHLDEGKAFQKIETNFQQILGALQKKEASFQKKTIQFKGGATLIIRDDIYRLFPNLENNSTLSIKPSVFKKIYDFFESALVKGSDGMVLINPDRTSKPQYVLFTKNSHILDFMSENLETLIALTELGLLNVDLYRSPPHYMYSDIPRSSANLNKIIIDQMVKSAPWRSHYQMHNAGKEIVSMFVYCLAFLKKHSKPEKLKQALTNLPNRFLLEDLPFLISRLGTSDDTLYPHIINICHLIRGEGSQNVSNILNKMNASSYAFFSNFLNQNDQFFTYVPMHAFLERLSLEMSTPQIQQALETLHQEYWLPDNQQQNRPGLAFEIHNFADQQVNDSAGPKKLNDAALAIIDQSLQTDSDRFPPLSYNQALESMKTVLSAITKEDKTRDEEGKAKHYPKSLTQENLTWVINQIDDDTVEQSNLSKIVRYLKGDHEKFKAWFVTFIDESARAYSNSQNQASCVKGVKERIVTSLRNINDPLFNDIFHQAEGSLLLKTKMASLSNQDFWAKKMFDDGVRNTTGVLVAKERYTKLLEDFFKDVKTEKTESEIHAAIESMKDLFDDFWSSFLASELTKLEVGGSGLNFGDGSVSIVK